MMINLKKLLEKILSSPIVIDQGEETTIWGPFWTYWTYRKWSDGLAECWGYTTVAIRTYGAQGGYVKVGACLPTGLFITTPKSIIASGEIDNNLYTGIGYTTADDSTTVQTYLINWHSVSITQAGEVYWHVKGRWK